MSSKLIGSTVIAHHSLIEAVAAEHMRTYSSPEQVPGSAIGSLLLLLEGAGNAKPQLLHIEA